MADKYIKNQMAKEITKMVKMKDVGKKMDETESPLKASDNDVYYPNLYLSTKQVPALSGLEVGNECVFVVTANVIRHELNETDNGSKECFDFEVRKIGKI